MEQKPEDVRKELDMSMEDMADLMEVHRETWAKWEKSKRHPNAAARTLMKVFIWMKKQGYLKKYISQMLPDKKQK